MKHIGNLTIPLVVSLSLHFMNTYLHSHDGKTSPFSTRQVYHSPCHYIQLSHSLHHHTSFFVFLNKFLCVSVQKLMVFLHER